MLLEPTGPTTLALILGASHFPSKDTLTPHSSFANSAKKFQHYLGSATGLNLPDANIRSFFDSSADSPSIHKEIRSFLNDRRKELHATGTPARDLICYYVGHGDFTQNREYLLAIQATTDGIEAQTSLLVSQLAATIRASARQLRQFLIFDACFSAASVNEFQSASAAIAREKVADAFRTFASGTLLFTSSSAKEASMAPESAELTMFTGAMLAALSNGDPQGKVRLTFDELRDLTEQQIIDSGNANPVRPELHAPGQASGNLATLPFFPNPARTAIGLEEVVRECVVETYFTQGEFRFPDSKDEDYFKHIVRVNDQEQELPIGSLASLIEENADADTPLVIEGPVKTGKSVLARLLYAALLQRRTTPTQRIPVFIDAATFKNTTEHWEERISLLQQLPVELAEAIDSSSDELVVIFDNVFELPHSSGPSADQLATWLTHNLDAARAIMCVNRCVSSRPRPLPGRVIGEVSPVRTTAAASRSYVQSYVTRLAPHTRNTTELSTRILSLANELQLETLDLLTLKLLARGVLPARRRPTSISSLCEQATAEFLPSGMTLATAADEIFRSHVNRSPSAPSMDRSPDREILHRYPVRDFLIGYGLREAVRRLASAAPPEKAFGAEILVDTIGPYREGLSHVFPVGVMRCCKDLMLREESDGQAILTVLRLLLRGELFEMLPVVSYLAGRLEIAPQQVQARQDLDSLRQYLKLGNHSRDPETAKRLRLVARTIYISLASLGSESATAEYLDELFRNKEWDALNRGFHLEYYGDVDYYPHYEMMHEDKLEPCPRTMRELIRKVESTQRGRLSLIEIYTLCSLVRHRHAAGKDYEEERGSVRRALQRVQNDRLIPRILQDLVTATLHEIGYPKFGVGVIVQNLYELKKLKRAGWRLVNDQVSRTVAQPESIADHLYACFLLAWLLLPERLEETGYDKNQILRMLLFHDIGEAFVGDVPSPLKNEKDRGQEDKWVSVLSLMSSHKDIAGEVFDVARIYREFESGATTNAKIASDIDKLENLVQLHLYWTEDPQTVSDFAQFRCDLESKIATDIGKSMLKIVTDHFVTTRSEGG
jgi:5'-deoxynucleotidase YfbR-like HD superfamily hydrolase